MKHRIDHDLQPAQAKNALDHAFASYAKRYPKYEPVLSWTSDRQATFAFNVKGKKLNGEAEVKNDHIAINLDVPFVFAMFKSLALQRIDQEAHKWIAKAKAGEL